MTFLADVDALKRRITSAEAVRDAWRISGRQENYLEACSMVDALEAQLEALERSARDSAAQERATAPNDPSSTPEELMARLRIVFDGRRFRYRAYRYDRLADAVNYAELEHRRSSPADRPVEQTVEQIREPTAAERELMRRHAITFDNGVFRWRGYQYDRLSDALAYSNLKPPAA